MLKTFPINNMKLSSMTPRERILAALNHQQPDGLPVDFGGTAVTTITAQAYDVLRNTLGFPSSQADILSFYGLTVKIEDDILEYFSSDTRTVFPRHGSNWTFSPQPDGEYDVFVDEWGIAFRKPKEEGMYFDLCRHPLVGFNGVAEIENHPFPQANDPSRIQGLREQCLAFREQGYPVIFGHTIGNGIMQGGARLCGYEEYFTRMLDVKKRVSSLINDSGFVFATVHNIQPDVPPENILAIFEALQEFR